MLLCTWPIGFESKRLIKQYASTSTINANANARNELKYGSILRHDEAKSSNGKLYGPKCTYEYAKFPRHAKHSKHVNDATRQRGRSKSTTELSYQSTISAIIITIKYDQQLNVGNVIIITRPKPNGSSATITSSTPIATKSDSYLNYDNQF